MPEGKKFCTKCGTPLSGGAPVQPVQQQPVPQQQPIQQQPNYQQQNNQQPNYQQPPSGGNGKFKKILILVIILAAAAIVALVVLFVKPGILVNKETQRTASRDRVRDEEEEDEDNKDDETEEETEEVTEEETEEVTETETKEEEGDWLETHDITLSPVGKFTFTTMMNDKTKDTDEMTVPATVSITEEKLPSSPGYKNVKGVFVYDLSEVTQAGVLADGVLDRYTGIAMEFDEDMEEELSKLYPGDADHFVRITNGDTHYDIYKKSNIETEMPTMTKTFEIICPEDYDGLVFYSGYDSLEIERLYDAMDMEARFYTFDELPYYDNGHDYYFFTYDEEAAARAGASAATSSAMKQEDGGSGQSDSSRQTDGTGQIDAEQTGGSKGSYTTDDIVELARIYEGAPEASLDSVDPDGTLNIHLYEIGQSNDATWNWYYIDPKTLKGTDLFGNEVDLNTVAR